ncbi:WD repeat-containing protein 90 isoform X4 [Pseudophryne corroboree]|uniref:WD repeat-containing protein 90 isoform X4 n=1 Tax=Pseudophryne corroboree TaxID=495146 RepID=UPI003081664F
MAGVWQHPFVNVFKHVRLEEWKRSSKEGDVSALMDKALKCTVYKIRGSIPAGNYIQIPKTSSQSLGLTGRYLYVLFRPVPGKHFVVHVDVSTEDGQSVRVSFSNLFKEFKSTATWLQFPFVCGAVKGSVYDSTAQTARHGLVGLAPSGSRWTCLLLDLQYILSLYLSRRYSHLKSVKLCSNLLVKNLVTSDLIFSPEVTFTEARQSKSLPCGVSPMPREMAFPVPKGEKWHDLYDFIRFPSDGSKLPYDSIQKGQSTSTAPGAPTSRSPVRENPRSVTISKPVQDRVSLIQQITSPRLIPRRSPLCADSMPERYLSVCGKAGVVADSEVESTAGEEEDDGGIHIYAHKDQKLVMHRHNADAQQVSSTKSHRPETFSAGTEAKKLLPDPILKLRKIIGFGGCTQRHALWTHTGCSIVYPCHAVIVSLNVESEEQRFFLGHTDKVSALAFNGSCTLLASAQTGALSMVRLWHFQKGSCLAMFKTHAHSVSYLSFSHTGSVLCGVGKDGHGKNMVVVWNTSQAGHGGEVVVLAKAHTDVDIHTMKIAFFDDTRMVSCGRDNIRLWRVRSGSLRSCPVNLGEFHNLEFTDLAFEVGHSPDREPEDRTLYVCSRSGHILEIDYKNMVLSNVRRLQPNPPQHSERREKQTFSSGNVVCKNSEQGPQALSLSRDGCLLAFVGPIEFTVTVMHGRSLDELLRIDVSILDLDSTKLDCALSLAFSPHRPYHLLVSTSGNKILWLDPKTGRLTREVTQVHKPHCFSLAVSDDNRYLLTAGDRIVKVWDYSLAGIARPQVFIGHSEPVQQVDFSPDQQSVITAGDAIFIWDFEAAPDPDTLVGSPGGGPTSVRQSSLNGPLPSTIHSSTDPVDRRRDSTFISSGVPRGIAPRPCISSPPRLDISPLQHTGCAGLLSESDDGDVAVAGSVHAESEEIDLQDPLESDGQSSLIIIESQPNRSKLPWVSRTVTSGQGKDVRQDPPRPDAYTHFNPRFKTPCLAKGMCPPPPNQEMLHLKAVIGYSGNGRGNMVWNPDTGFFAYTCGCVIVVEDLHSGLQRHWLGHPEELSSLALTHDAMILASSSGSGDGFSICQIRIWDTQEGICKKILQYHQTEVQAMSFSRDDRLLVTVGDFRDGKLALWSTRTYEMLASSKMIQPVHAVSFNPTHANTLACVGTAAVNFCRIEENGTSSELKLYRAAVPDEVGSAELTSLTYNPTSLLYTGCSTGQVCVWDAQTHRCFMTWEADQGEIGVLLCRGNRLVTGSNTRRIRLWSVAAVQELREKGSEASSSSVLMEQEMTLDGAVVSATFDDALEMGIVGTTASTLWYINWVENTSIRLISGHRSKVTDLVVGPGETHCATCGEDGSVRVWSLHSCELLLQFQVLNQSCLCLDWSHQASSGQRIAAGYSDGTIRIFSVSNTEMEMKIHPHPCAVTAIAFSRTGDVLLSGGKDGLMAISSPRTGMTIRILSDHKGSPITAIQCSPRKAEELGLQGGEIWLAASLDRRVSVWASDWLKDKCELLDWLSFPAPDSEKEAESPIPTLAAFCPWQPGTVVYAGFGMQKEVLFYSLAQKQVLLSIPLSHFATSLSMSPAASLLALGSRERLLRVIDSSTGTQQDFSAHDDCVHLCRVSPSGNLLFTASYNQVLVWDIQNS